MTISQDPNTEPRRNEILMTKSKKIEKVKKKLRERIKISCNTKIKELRGITQAKSKLQNTHEKKNKIKEIRGRTQSQNIKTMPNLKNKIRGRNERADRS